MSGGGRFDFDDGGTYCGGWEVGKAQGHGVCTGPKGQGEFSGTWSQGFEVLGVYLWPSGNMYEGQWIQGKRDGLGVEKKGHWEYRGEWSAGFKGRYGLRQNMNSEAHYEGTWTTGIQDGYGVESYADGGVYAGQWLRGTRHGYGVRRSVPYGIAARYHQKGLRDSMTSLRSESEPDSVVREREEYIQENRGGFVLKDEPESNSLRRITFEGSRTGNKLKRSFLNGLGKLRKQRSVGDLHDSGRKGSPGSLRSAQSAMSNVTYGSNHTESVISFASQYDPLDANLTEVYKGEWKNDKRSGFGIAERSNGMKYEGEWFNNCKSGYGCTTYPDGRREQGRYRNNVLLHSNRKSVLVALRQNKLKEKVEDSIQAALRAAQTALQKADIAITRQSNARAKAEQALSTAALAREASDLARLRAKEFAPDFKQPGTETLRKRLKAMGSSAESDRCNNMSPVQSLGRSHSLMMLKNRSTENLSESSKGHSNTSDRSRNLELRKQSDTHLLMDSSSSKNRTLPAPQTLPHKKNPSFVVSDASLDCTDSIVPSMRPIRALSSTTMDKPQLHIATIASKDDSKAVDNVHSTVKSNRLTKDRFDHYNILSENRLGMDSAGLFQSLSPDPNKRLFSQRKKDFQQSTSVDERDPTDEMTSGECHALNHTNNNNGCIPSSCGKNNNNNSFQSLSHKTAIKNDRQPLSHKTAIKNDSQPQSHKNISKFDNNQLDRDNNGLRPRVSAPKRCRNSLPDIAASGSSSQQSNCSSYVHNGANASFSSDNPHIIHKSLKHIANWYKRRRLLLLGLAFNLAVATLFLYLLT